MKGKSIGKSILAVIIGTVWFFVLGRYIAISIPGTNDVINVQGSVLAVFGVIFGPIVGVIIGLVGQILVEMSWFGLTIKSYTWSTIVAAAVFGYLIGFLGRAIHINNRKFNGRKMVIFNIMQIIANGIAWFIVAPILKVIIYKQGLGRQLLQGLITWGANIVIVAIFGTLLLAIYAKAKPQKVKKRKITRKEST